MTAETRRDAAKEGTMTAQALGMTILVADDDPDDRALARDAFIEARVPNRIDFVEDGEELLAYLRHEGRYADAREFPAPGLILLDLNMPRLGGREALAEIKSDPALRHIPVVVMTTSKSTDDVVGSYQSGSNSYITKPTSFQSLLDVVRALRRYWMEVVDLPAVNQED
jgi:two-component system, response regulator